MSSSTSSSERGLARLPWAGLLALGALLLIDRLLFGFAGPWQRLALDDPNSVARSRLELARLAQAPPGQPRVVVVGTSRVLDGFDEELARRLLPGAAFAKMGYPRFEPVAIRALVPDLLAAGADAVCLLASEQDTHRPLRLEPVPGASAASLGTLLDLWRATDWRFFVENRTSLYRFAATALLRLYRYRPDLHRAGLGAGRRFASDERLADERPRADPIRPVALWGAYYNPVKPAASRSTFDLYPPGMDSWKSRMQSSVMQEVTPGRHVPVQMFLLRRAVEILREGGVEVVIVEGVVHPAAGDLYDVGLREPFLAFARGLERELGAHFVPHEEAPPFAESDFYDLLHTNRQGAAKITRSLVRALRRTPIVGPLPPAGA